MRRRRHGRGDRGVLKVPAMPGTAPYGMTPVEAPTSPHQRAVRLAVAAVGIAAIVITTVLLARSPSHKAATVTTTATVPAATTPAPRVHRMTAAQKAHAAAVKLAAKLPVRVETAALLRKGDAVWVVGGTTTKGGKPSDGIWRIDLKTKQVHHAGTFIEPLTDAGAASRAGVLYVSGGWTGEKLGTAVLRWKPGESPTLVVRLPVAARGENAAFAGKTLYVQRGKTLYAVDVDAGTVTTATKVPAQLGALGSNTEYLAHALR